MRFFALQVTCESCDNSFLAGGAAANDLDIWRDALLECPRCGAACPATDSDVVGLTSRRREVDPEPLLEARRIQRRRSLPWLGWDRRADLAVE